MNACVYTNAAPLGESNFAAAKVRAKTLARYFPLRTNNNRTRPVGSVSVQAV